MALKDRTQLKEYFQKGKRPTEAEFGNLIDSVALVSQIPEIPVKPYKVFSALLRIDDESIEFGNPIYVPRFRLLEENTIGELDIIFGRHDEFLIRDLSGEGKLNFERRFITIGTLRDDFNFNFITESGDLSNDFIQLNFGLRSDGISIPDQPVTPLFYNLPIEIRIYDDYVDLGTPIPFPGGGTIDLGTAVPGPGHVTP